jgi:hypothetical protein
MLKSLCKTKSPGALPKTEAVAKTVDSPWQVDSSTSPTVKMRRFFCLCLQEVLMSHTFTHGYALLIGVDENRVSGYALPNVAKDIQAVAKVLVHPQRCAYPKDNIKTLTGQEATRQGILDGLEWLQEHIQADSSDNTTAIVYYTGHGWRNTSAGSSEFYLIPYDIREGKIKSRALRATDLAEAVSELEPRRLLVVLNCCHAGGMGVKGLPLSAGYVEAAIAPSLLMEGSQVHRLRMNSFASLENDRE